MSHSSRLPIGLVAWLCSELWTASLIAQPHPPEDQVQMVSVPEAPGNVATRQPRQLGKPLEKGFVFLEGRYLEPPHTITLVDDQVRVSGQAIDGPLMLSQFSPYHAGRSAGPVSPRLFAHQLQLTLQDEGMLIALKGQPASLFPRGTEPWLILRETMLSATPEPVAFTRLYSYLPQSTDPVVWLDWLDTRPVPEQARERLQTLTEEEQEIEKRNLQSVTTNQNLAALAYPLTTLGMMICVFSIGHLLLYRPDPMAKPYEVNLSPQMAQMVRTSLVLIVIFSTLDLVWTLLAHGAGQMKELNPLGNGLIDSPLSLAIFKGVATLVAVGLLFAVRKYPRGQLATWWVCLIVTLITIRWVAFNSMFVS